MNDEKNVKECAKQKGEAITAQEKMFWFVMIITIIFMVLLIGSLIGLKITRNGINNVINGVNNLDVNNKNNMTYMVLDDGTKENVSDGVVNATFELDGIIVSNASISEREGTTEIALDVSNTTENEVTNQMLLVKLYNEEDNLISELGVKVNKIEAKEKTTIKTLLLEKCVGAKKIVVELAG